MQKPPNQKPRFFCLFFALVFLAGCTGETLPTDTSSKSPAETLPEATYDIRVVLQNRDIPLNDFLQKGFNAAAQADDRVRLIAYKSTASTYTALLSTLLAEGSNGILASYFGALPSDIRETSKTMVVILNDTIASYNLFQSASVDDEDTVQVAVKLASDNMVKKGFYMIMEETPSHSLDWSSIARYDYPKIYGLTSVASYTTATATADDLELEMNSHLYDSADRLSRKGDNDLVIFTKTEEWLLMILDMVKAIDFSGRNILIIGYSRDYVFTEKTYNAMRENPDIFIGVVCTNFFEMGKRSAEGIAAYLDGKSSQEVAAYFDLPFHTITNKTLEDPDVQVFLREMDVLPIRR